MSAETISIAALVISGLTFLIMALGYWDIKRSNISAKRLSEQEIELVRHQLSGIRKGAVEDQMANVSARLYESSKHNFRLRVYNSGPDLATNVRIVLNDQNEVITLEEIESKFPMDRMEKGHSVDCLAFISMSSPSTKRVSDN